MIATKLLQLIKLRVTIDCNISHKIFIYRYNWWIRWLRCVWVRGNSVQPLFGYLNNRLVCCCVFPSVFRIYNRIDRSNFELVFCFRRSNRISVWTDVFLVSDTSLERTRSVDEMCFNAQFVTKTVAQNETLIAILIQD